MADVQSEQINRCSTPGWLRRAAACVLLAILAIFAQACTGEACPGGRDGSDSCPLRVMLIPADGGTASGTLADFQPLFDAVSRKTGLKFEIRVGDSYAAVIESMATGRVELAFFGPMSFMQARRRGAAELLAVAETEGLSLYHAGIFVRADSDLHTLEDLKGRSIALGDLQSASSFIVPVAEMIVNGLDPAADLGRVVLAGNHANALAAVEAGRADAAGASLLSHAKGVEEGGIAPGALRVLHRSAGIPYPPIAMHTQLDEAVKAKLREAFATLHDDPSIGPRGLRGYAGQPVDRFITDFPVEAFDELLERLSVVTPEVNQAMLRKAGQR
ncbi:MAG: phosphate/phosphite/phosphonate ABC transporter substrate-binding protein [Phycisphaerales bacterium]|nr:phosphate/phosphite/phosphonate ABC transporter substrate-binding protein [Phycisphaerales bacterium]